MDQRWTYQLLVKMRPRPFESSEYQTGGMKVEGASGAERPLVDRDIAEVEAADGLADGGATDGARSDITEVDVWGVVMEVEARGRIGGRATRTGQTLAHPTLQASHAERGMGVEGHDSPYLKRGAYVAMQL